MVKIQIIVGSTRPGRIGIQVGKWVTEELKKRKDIEVELVDIEDFNLPLLDEPMPAMMKQYTKDHTKIWSEKISEADGYIFVTPEYNHSISGALKNAIDFLSSEWNNKAAGIVSYGYAGGIRAAENLRLIMGDLQIADVTAQVLFFIGQDFENNTLKANEMHSKQLNSMLNQLVKWSEALKSIRG